MNATIVTTDDLVTNDRLDRGRGTDTRQEPSAPTLDAVVAAICLDATHDSLKFVLRSDTGHDGE